MADIEVLVLGIDTSLLQAQYHYAVTISQGEIERAIPIEVNNSGHALFNDVVDEIAKDFPEVPPQVIASALTSREASALLPSFGISSDEKMVTYVEWVTSRDEKVCPICGPRDGVVYRIIDVMDIYPAHPNCRCRIERLSITDSMLRAGAELLPDAMERVAEGVLEQFSRVWARF
jgi:SPP1 gp7 family putative phage head morphogenesis protein